MSTDYPITWKLPPNLIALSEAKTWSEALREWNLTDIEQLADETCLCNHYPISEVCHIANEKNGKTAIVGNCCVKRFEVDTVFEGTHKIFSALKRMRADENASANKELIQYAYENKVFSEKDYKFYNDIWRKRKLTEGQEEYKANLNERLITHMSRKKDREETARVVAKRSLEDSFNILKDQPTKMADQQLIEKAHEDRILSDKDHEFYKGLWDKGVSSPSLKQKNWLGDLNTRMLKRMKV